MCVPKERIVSIEETSTITNVRQGSQMLLKLFFNERLKRQLKKNLGPGSSKCSLPHFTQLAARSSPLLPGRGRSDDVLRLRVAEHRQLSGLCDNRLEGGRWLHVLDDTCWCFHDRQLMAPCTSKVLCRQTAVDQAKSEPLAHGRLWVAPQDAAPPPHDVEAPSKAKTGSFCHLVRLFLFLAQHRRPPDCEIFSICPHPPGGAEASRPQRVILCVQDVGEIEHIHELFYTVWQQMLSSFTAVC